MIDRTTTRVTAPETVSPSERDKRTAVRTTLLLVAVCTASVSCQIGLASGVSDDDARTESKLPAVDVGWRFKIGDDRSWSEPELDDSRWQPIRTGRSWEEQGFSDVDGFGWYRLRFHMPRNVRDDPDVQRFRALKITLGKIDDVDETWINGTLIGTTGTFPDNYETAWRATRSYEIPLTAIRWGAENVVAIRVYDGKGPGGMYEGDCRLAAPTLGDFLAIDFDLGRRGDGIFIAASGMPVAANLRNDARVPAVGEVHWKIENDAGGVLATDTSIANVPAGGQTVVRCRYTPKKAGFYRATCELRNATDGSVGKRSMVLGYRPAEIRSPLTRQDDFDEFWRSTLASLAAVSPRYVMERRPDLDTATHEVHTVEMRSLGDVRVRGWYEKPVADGPHPALLRVPGYGSSMRPLGNGDPLAVLSFDIRGHGMSRDDVSGTPVNYWIRGLDAPRGYFYQGAYADCVRAVDFLASRPEVDVGRIAVTGGSQGGGLSLATAALDQRVSFCAPDIPFLCDWVAYFEATHWPEGDDWVKAKPHRSWEKTLRTLSYFDTLNLAERIRCPVFLGLGLQDRVCPPATIFAVYDRLAGPKEYRVYPRAGHWVEGAHEEERRGRISRRFRWTE